MFGQVGFFHKFAGREIEDKRPARALSRRIQAPARRAWMRGSTDRDWIMGDEYTIADISMLGWVRNLIGFYGARELVDYRRAEAGPRLARARARPSGGAARIGNPQAAIEPPRRSRRRRFPRRARGAQTAGPRRRAAILLWGCASSDARRRRSTLPARDERTPR